MNTTNIGALYFGRFIIGLANGLFDTFAQLYIFVRLPSTTRIALGLRIDRNARQSSIGE